MDFSNKDLNDYISIFYRRIWILVIPTVFGLAVGAYLYINAQEYYRSTTLILVEKQTVPEKYVAPTDTTPISQRLNTISQQLMSRTKLEKIINDFDLYSSKQQPRTKLSMILDKVTLKGDGKPSTESLIQRMRNDIDVNVMGRSGDAFSISYTGRDPHVTMRVTSTLASMFIEENLKRREQFAEGTSEFINSELDKAKLELEEQERALREFKEMHMGSLPAQLDANLRTLDRFQLELQTIDNSIKDIETRKAAIESRLLYDSATPGDGSAGTGPNVQEVELARLKNDLARLLSMYKENYPDVQITKNRIREIENQLAASRLGADAGSAGVSADVNYLAPNIRALNAQLKELTERRKDAIEQIKTYERRVERTFANEQRLADLTRDYRSSLENYQNLLKKKLNARLAENLEKKQKGERFRVIDPANLPEKSFKRNANKTFALSAMGGFGTGAGIVLLLEFMSPTYRKPEEVEEALLIPVLAVVPEFTTKKKRAG